MIVEPADLRTFVRESNRIEGINRQPRMHELVAHQNVLALPELTVALLASSS